MRRALGLGLTILILKFLVSEVFVAGENLLINTLNTANRVMSSASANLAEFDANQLAPR